MRLGSLSKACLTIAKRSAIVCDYMETPFCDRLRSCDHDRRRAVLSSAIVRDQLRSCDRMETKVLRSAIEIYPIICRILSYGNLVHRAFHLPTPEGARKVKSLERH